ncbi:hypothetical protein [Rothia sp. RSM386]|uniref:hypothetical protein n=1 Tax=Rothia sp. RSM386 TaxID=3030213 RepID=UPI00244A31B9|nr:hypothetical protein [Rothia sp. RSM386]
MGGFGGYVEEVVFLPLRNAVDQQVCIVILLLLALLSTAGVLYIDTDPWTPETNFAPWFLVSALVAIRLFAFSSAEPTGEIPDLHRMMQFNRYIHWVTLVSSAVLSILCALIPLVNLSTAGYDPMALAVSLFLTAGFLYFVREGLFYLQGSRFEDGTGGYSILRGYCVGMVGLAGCMALGYLGYSLLRKEWLPALFFTASVAMNAWSVKKYVTVGISIPEDEEDDEVPETTPVTG